MNRKILFAAVLIIFCVVGFWAIKYFALFQKIPTSQVVLVDVDPSEDQNNPQSSSPVESKLEEVASGLFVPWSIVFTSPTRMLVTERNGKIRVVESGLLRSEPIHSFTNVSQKSEEGLMGMAMDHDYPRSKALFFCYAYSAGAEMKARVVRLIDQGNSLSDEKIIIDNIPAAQFHAGCRIKFGPDGMLYITTGDATDKQIAQDKNSLGGKILRLNNDGSIPIDNPFPNSPIFSFGHRNPQGIDWDPVTGELFETEHGPSVFDGPAGGDEINLIKKGENYGWPIVSHEKSRDGLVSPLITFTPAVAPGSAMFYRSDTFPQWKNFFFFGGLKGEGIFKVEIKNGKIIAYEKLKEVNVGRIREIVEGPEGFIYFTTSNLDGRGNARNGDDKVYRLVPR